MLEQINLIKSIRALITRRQFHMLTIFHDNNCNIGNTCLDLNLPQRCVGMMLQRVDKRLPADFFIESEIKTKQRFRNVIGINDKYLEGV